MARSYCLLCPSNAATTTHSAPCRNGVQKTALHRQSGFTVSVPSADSLPSCLRLIYRASILHLLSSPILLVLLFALVIFHFGILAIPTPYIDPTSPSFDCAHKTRTIWIVIWTCVVTILSCIWAAVRPNIPSIKDNTWKVF
ncbi:hypothetical protein HETIRDRAFT_433430 [Heterobasidion irregulare TC 32-1]|uniref:Uncharacterized protein n=1 Tax=Heterobasidion irregulare (strain TC 32-1) TaxID=747525 RepID=W4KI48_HETIT|nr:uncharacterized protein HETIRDRAFT_433430 [Heterobasidion irregulare TC 32-1]ETW84746.1 hypothetical protein HETIRDRAFT_433430 [Heterobasidion irregulare TC 32-1]